MTFFTVPEAESEYTQHSNPGGDRAILTDVASRCGSRVYRDNNAALESEGKSGGTVLNLYPARWVCTIIGVHLEELSGLYGEQELIRSR